MRLLFILFFLAPLLTVAETQVIPLTPAELASKADLVLLGLIEKKVTKRDPSNRIYTEVTLNIRETWKGNPKTNPLIIVLGGGALGEQQVIIPGQVDYHIGEEVVAFLVWNPSGEAVTLGMDQGKFSVFESPAGVKQAYNRFHGAPPQTNSPGVLKAKATSKTLPLNELKALVQQTSK